MFLLALLVNAAVLLLGFIISIVYRKSRQAGKTSWYYIVAWTLCAIGLMSAVYNIVLLRAHLHDMKDFLVYWGGFWMTLAMGISYLPPLDIDIGKKKKWTLGALLAEAIFVLGFLSIYIIRPKF